MFVATIFYSLCAMALSSMAAHYHIASGPTARAVPHRMVFYISLLRFGALVAFILLAYPVLFNLSDPAIVFTDAAQLLETTSGLLLVLAGAVLLSWFGTASRVASWVLYLQGILFLTWLFGRISRTLGADVLLYPNWQFFGLSCVLCAACLLVCELALWLPAGNPAGRQVRTLRDLARQLCVLPALVIYSFGLGMRL